MRVTLSDTALQKVTGELLAVPVPEPGTLSASAAAVDQAVGGRLSELIRAEGFTGKRGTTATLFAPDTPFRRVTLVGVGAQPSPEAMRRYAAVAVRRARDAHATRIALASSVEGPSAPEHVRAVVEGAGLGAYRFDRYRASDGTPAVEEAAILASGGDRTALGEALRLAEAAVQATCLARDLVNEPANVLTPTALADTARAVAEAGQMRCRIIELDDARAMGMGLFAAVAAASDQPAKFIVMEYEPAGKQTGTRRVALVGKGITFDSGGLSIKTAGGMSTMKGDMGGAAAVVGAMSGLLAYNVPVRVLGIAAATENMISGRAVKPGDIVRGLGGKTVEINNTDAEGRLVLADALAFAVREGATELIDLATLTGSCVIALGDHTAGLMGNNQPLMDRILRAGAETGEQIWQLPMYDEFLDAMRGEISDLKNSGGRQAGAERAAAFMGEFVAGTPWAHLDIAGPAFYDEKFAAPYISSGGTGFGVRTLLRYLVSPA